MNSPASRRGRNTRASRSLMGSKKSVSNSFGSCIPCRPKGLLGFVRLNVLALEAAEKCQVSVQALSTRYILPIVSASSVTTEKVVGVRLALR
jgi:hypothetical protein